MKRRSAATWLFVGLLLVCACAEVVQDRGPVRRTRQALGNLRVLELEESDPALSADQRERIREQLSLLINSKEGQEALSSAGDEARAAAAVITAPSAASAAVVGKTIVGAVRADAGEENAHGASNASSEHEQGAEGGEHEEESPSKKLEELKDEDADKEMERRNEEIGKEVDAKNKVDTPGGSLERSTEKALKRSDNVARTTAKEATKAVVEKVKRPLGKSEDDDDDAGESFGVKEANKVREDAKKEEEQAKKELEKKEAEHKVKEKKEEEEDKKQDEELKKQEEEDEKKADAEEAELLKKQAEQDKKDEESMTPEEVKEREDERKKEAEDRAKAKEEKKKKKEDEEKEKEKDKKEADEEKKKEKEDEEKKKVAEKEEAAKAEKERVAEEKEEKEEEKAKEEGEEAEEAKEEAKKKADEDKNDEEEAEKEEEEAKNEEKQAEGKEEEAKKKEDEDKNDPNAEAADKTEEAQERTKEEEAKKKEDEEQKKEAEAKKAEEEEEKKEAEEEKKEEAAEKLENEEKDKKEDEKDSVEHKETSNDDDDGLGIDDDEDSKGGPSPQVLEPTEKRVADGAAADVAAERMLGNDVVEARGPKIVGANANIVTHTIANDPNSKLLHYPPPGYDRKRPPAGDKVKIKFNVVVNRITTVEDWDGTASLSYTTNMVWIDARLNYMDATTEMAPGEKYLVYTGDDVEKLWLPHYWLHGAQDHHLVRSRALVYPDGTVVYTQTRSSVVVADIDVTWFPFDSCFVNLTMVTQGYNAEQVMFYESEDMTPLTDEKASNWFLSEALLPEDIGHWTLKNFTGKAEIYKFSDGSTRSVIVSRAELSRNPLYYLTGYILPIDVMVLFAGISFWVNPLGSGAMARFGIYFGVLFTLMAFHYMMTEDLPRAGYLMWLNAYMLGQYTCVLIPLVFHTVSSCLQRPSTQVDSEKGGAQGQSVGAMKWLLCCLPGGFSSTPARVTECVGFVFFFLFWVAFNATMYIILLEGPGSITKDDMQVDLNGV